MWRRRKDSGGWGRRRDTWSEHAKMERNEEYLGGVPAVVQWMKNLVLSLQRYGFNLLPREVG